MVSKINLFLIFLLFALFGCGKSDNIIVKIMTEDVNLTCNISCFRGIEPDIYYKDLLAIAGEPNDFDDKGRKDEPDNYNPVYYSSVGKLMGYWSGKNCEQIGLVEYTPYRTSNVPIKDFVYQPELYNIDDETDIVAVFKDDTLYYLVYLDSMKIKQIEFWKTKKRFGNIAHQFD